MYRTERGRTTSQKFQITITRATLNAVTAAAAAVAVWRRVVGRYTSRVRRETWTWFGCCWTTERWWMLLITSWNVHYIWLFAVGRRCATHSGRLSNYSVAMALMSTPPTRR